MWRGVIRHCDPLKFCDFSFFNKNPSCHLLWFVFKGFLLMEYSFSVQMKFHEGHMKSDRKQNKFLCKSYNPRETECCSRSVIQCLYQSQCYWWCYFEWINTDIYLFYFIYFFVLLLDWASIAWKNSVRSTVQALTMERHTRASHTHTGPSVGRQFHRALVRCQMWMSSWHCRSSKVSSLTQVLDKMVRRKVVTLQHLSWVEMRIFWYGFQGHDLRFTQWCYWRFQIFWDVILCHWVGGSWCFEELLFLLAAPKKLLGPETWILRHKGTFY